MPQKSTYDELLEQVHVWLSKPDGLDEEVYENILDLALKRVIQSVRNYLNLIEDDKLPYQLNYTVVAMTAQLIDSYGWLSQDEAGQAGSGVQSLTEGDTSITFKSASEIYAALQSANPVTSAYISELNNFRKLPL